MSEHEVEKTGSGNRPVETLRDGALKVAIFRNQNERGESYSMVPGRIYTDQGTGEVREVTSLGGSEPLRMAHLLTKGHDRITELREKRKAQTPERGKDEPEHER
jgi:hypothetical protein